MADHRRLQTLRAQTVSWLAGIRGKTKSTGLPHPLHFISIKQLLSLWYLLSKKRAVSARFYNKKFSIKITRFSRCQTHSSTPSALTQKVTGQCTSSILLTFDQDLWYWDNSGFLRLPPHSQKMDFANGINSRDNLTDEVFLEVLFKRLFYKKMRNGKPDTVKSKSRVSSNGSFSAGFRNMQDWQKAQAKASLYEEMTELQPTSSVKQKGSFKHEMEYFWRWIGKSYSAVEETGLLNRLKCNSKGYGFVGNDAYIFYLGKMIQVHRYIIWCEKRDWDNWKSLIPAHIPRMHIHHTHLKACLTTSTNGKPFSPTGGERLS